VYACFAVNSWAGGVVPGLLDTAQIASGASFYLSNPQIVGGVEFTAATGDTTTLQYRGNACLLFPSHLP
jgi:hypothetical protein